MKKINLRELYPDAYTTDFFVNVTEDVLETIRASERAEAAYERKMYRYKAQYSLDCENGIVIIEISMILFRTKWYLPLMSRTADMWLLFQTCRDASPVRIPKKRQQRTRRMQNELGLKPHWKAMQKPMNQRFKFKESYGKDLQQQYLDTESNSRLFFDTFFELCRKFNIQYSIATTQEKAFIDEVTESIYERKKAERDGKAPTYQQRV